MASLTVRTPDGKIRTVNLLKRITSIGRFVTGKFAIMDDDNPKYFDSLPADQRAKILASKLLIYECEGAESEIKQWFDTINTAGVPACSPVGSTPISRGVGVAIRSTSSSTAASWAATAGSSATCSGRT